MSCEKCKKKKVIKQLDPIIEEDIWVPTREEIKLAYAEFNSILGVKNDKREFVSKVYKYLFNEDLIYDCRGCGGSQARRFHNYMKGF